jgi:hypothetical protein
VYILLVFLMYGHPKKLRPARLNHNTHLSFRLIQDVSESVNFKNIMNSKCLRLFSFNTYKHNAYINEFRFFQFQFNPFSNLTQCCQTRKAVLQNHLIHWRTLYFIQLTNTGQQVLRSSIMANGQHGICTPISSKQNSQKILIHFLLVTKIDLAIRSSNNFSKHTVQL